SNEHLAVDLNQDFGGSARQFLRAVHAAESVLSEVEQARNSTPSRELDPNNPWDQAAIVAIAIAAPIAALANQNLSPDQREIAQGLIELRDWIGEDPDRASVSYSNYAVEKAVHLARAADLHAAECGPAPTWELSALEESVDQLIDAVLVSNPQDDQQRNVIFNAALRLASELQLERRTFQVRSPRTPGSSDNSNSNQDDFDPLQARRSQGAVEDDAPLRAIDLQREDDYSRGNDSGEAPISQRVVRKDQVLDNSNLSALEKKTSAKFGSSDRLAINTEPIPRAPEDKAINTEPIPRRPEAKNSKSINTEPIPRMPEEKGGKAINTEPIPVKGGDKSKKQVQASADKKAARNSKAINTEPIP
ncbi:MAG: hypothetical protein KDD42_07630, partial [Bdellovibrionales bacterium]|nr:hypothetical protein [Bdellovibrionales bacterium]